MIVYSLNHEYKTGKKLEYTEAKLIGYFSKKRTIRYVIKKYKKLPGFHDYHTLCFVTRKIVVQDTRRKNINWNERVYVVEHAYDTENSWFTVVTFFGAFIDKKMLKSV